MKRINSSENIITQKVRLAVKKENKLKSTFNEAEKNDWRKTKLRWGNFFHPKVRKLI